MRWPFRRSEPQPPPPAGVDGPTAAPAGEPAREPAWATLPPLQRTAPDTIPLTAPSSGIVGDVAERWMPATVLEPLGHDVGPLAPVGTIGLTAAPVEAAGGGPELVTRPSARPGSVQRTAAVADAPPSSPAELPPLVVARLPVVDSQPASVVAARSLTSAVDPIGATTASIAATADGDDASRGPLPVDAPAATGHPVQRASPGLEPLPRPRRGGLGAPLASGRPGLPVQRTTDVPQAPSAAVRAAEPGGIGPGPDPVRPLDPQPRLHVQRLALGELPVVRAATPPADAAAATVQRSDDPTDHVEPTPGADPGPSPRPGASSAAMSDPGEGRPATPAAVMTGSIDVSRLASSDAVRHEPALALRRSIGGRSGPVSIQRQADDARVPDPAAGPESVLVTGPRPTTRPAVEPIGPQVTLSRWGADGPGAVRAPVAPRSEGHEPTRSPASEVVVARLATDPVPAGLDIVQSPGTVQPAPRAGSPASRPLPVQRSASSSATATASAAARPVALSLALSPARATSAARAAAAFEVDDPTATGPSAIASAADDLPSIQRSASDAGTGPGNAASFDASLQRAAADEGAAGDDGPTGSAPTATATSTPGGGPFAGGSDKDLDELARRLYDRFRQRLTRELLADRERAGILTDLR